MLYHEAARILKVISEKKGTVKSLCITSKYKNKKELYAVVCESLKYSEIISQIISRSKILQEEKILRPDKHLVTVLLYDFLFAKDGLKKCNKKLQEAVLRHKTTLRSTLVRIKVKENATCNEDLVKHQQASVTIPRYVRVNRLKATVKQVQEWFVKNGFVLLPTPQTHDEFLSQVDGLKKKQFFEDLYIEDVLVFANTDFHDNPLYKDGRIILQDKASCVPAFVLRPPPSACVLDACAAPGNKTGHACAYMENKGTMHAFELAGRRVGTMRRLLGLAGVTCARFLHQDFLTAHTTDPAFADVEYAIVDPSCSGSGIVSRLGNLTDDAASVSSERLAGLAMFQVSVLSHALSFPAMKKVVYSTCSIHDQENEEVVKTVLEKFKDKFHLCDIVPDWPSRGRSEVFPGAARCLRLSPDSDRTNGFFVACFERKGCNGDVMDSEPAAEKTPVENTTSEKTTLKKTTPEKTILEKTTPEKTILEKTTPENTTSIESKMDTGDQSNEEKSGNDVKHGTSAVEPIPNSGQNGNSKKQRKRKRKKDEKAVEESETESAAKKRNCVENITNAATVVNPTSTSTTQKKKKKKKKGPKKAITA